MVKKDELLHNLIFLDMEYILSNHIRNQNILSGFKFSQSNG